MCHAKFSSKNEDEINTFSDKQKLRDLSRNAKNKFVTGGNDVHQKSDLRKEKNIKEELSNDKRNRKEKLELLCYHKAHVLTIKQ